MYHMIVGVVAVGDEGAPKQEHSASESPHPLPMPAYGGYYAPLSNLLSESAMPTPLYQRLVSLATRLCALIIELCNQRLQLNYYGVMMC